MNRISIFNASALLLFLNVIGVGAFAQTQLPKIPKPKPAPSTTRLPDSASPKLTARTSGLTVVAEANARITLQPLGGTVRNQPNQANQPNRKDCQIEAERRSCVFDNLNPGNYLVSVKLEGYEDAKSKDGRQEVRLVPGKSAVVEFDLRQIAYTITLKTNVRDGQALYQTGLGRAPVDIKNGIAVLRDLPVGSTDVEIQSAGYQTLRHKILAGPGQQTVVELKLERRLSDTPLAANWASLEEWDAPAGWATAANKLSAKGAGVALPRSEHLGHYADFELVTDVKMVNAIAASFALRAQDKRNYYLIQITGSAADRPYVLRGFVVKDGSVRPFPTAPINVNAYDSLLGNGQFFELTIQCIGNKFTVYLGDNQSGTPLGTLSDPDNHFPNGAPGIVVRDEERQEIARFVVTPAKNGSR